MVMSFKLTEEQVSAAFSAIKNALRGLTQDDTVRVAIWFDAPESSHRKRDRALVVRVPRERAFDADEYGFNHYPLIKELVMQQYRVSKTHVLSGEDCEEM